MKFPDLWPFVLKGTHAITVLENYTLRDALREANAELLRHRQLLAGLRTGQRETTEQLERVWSKPR